MSPYTQPPYDPAEPLPPPPLGMETRRPQEPRRDCTTASHLMAQTYWAAEGRSWQLQVLASQTTDAEERAALLDLLMAEQHCQAIASRALATVWGIILPRGQRGGLA